MTPGTLTRGHEYTYNDIRLTYMYETINDYVFKSIDHPDKGFYRLTFTQVKNQLTELQWLYMLISTSPPPRLQKFVTIVTGLIYGVYKPDIAL